MEQAQMERETENRRTITIRALDGDLWRQVKSVAALEDTSVADIVERAVKEYLKTRKK